MWRGFVYIERRKQWNGREDEKSMMMIVSNARYIRVPASSMAGLPQQQQQQQKSPNHLVYLDVLLLYHHF